MFRIPIPISESSNFVSRNSHIDSVTEFPGGAIAADGFSLERFKPIRKHLGQGRSWTDNHPSAAEVRNQFGDGLGIRHLEWLIAHQTEERVAKVLLPLVSPVSDYKTPWIVAPATLITIKGDTQDWQRMAPIAYHGTLDGERNWRISAHQLGICPPDQLLFLVGFGPRF